MKDFLEYIGNKLEDFPEELKVRKSCFLCTFKLQCNRTHILGENK